TNGEMPEHDLVAVAPNCIAYRAAAPSLGLLLATARNEGVALGTNQCYRSLAGQVAAQQRATARGNSACAASVPKTASGAPKGTSMHGWGKAADLEFGPPGAGFLDATAGRVGWNHPGWARPGGSACPEPWHWEWVGDGGIFHLSSVRADVVALLPSRDGGGYSTVTGLGALVHRGDAPDAGSAADSPLGWVVVGGAPTPSGRGYWLVCGDGTVLRFGDAPVFGSVRAGPPASPVVGMAALPAAHGDWL